MPYNPSTERLDQINESLLLIQSKTGLAFGTDSYLLAAFARSSPRGTCVELGGGTGVVSLLAVSRGRFAKIYAAEIQPYFADLIRRNAALNHLDDRVFSLCADVRDLTSAAFGGEVHSVLSNPPYMKADSGKTNAASEMNVARREENGTIADFCAAAGRLLRWGGYFTVVYRPDRFADLLCAMRENGLEPKRAVLVYPSAADKPCLVLTEAKKGGASGLVFARPLLIYEDKAAARYTDDMQQIYDTFSMEHLF
ncbi:MAG: tRNA1(Val) (adenine(37)-N6)-methyltransferase [Eubacteriales bacterium]